MNKQKLRDLAKKATPGPWIAGGPSFGADFPVYCDEVLIDRDGDDDDVEMICRAPLGLEESSTDDMTYIAAANPATILALLDETAALLEALREIAEWTERYTAAGHPVSTVARAAIAKYSEA